jgi:alkanesulfonate monooxygenase SsuD/methylene tetrahydromethanopterin reductase-like flavin-dependent oxidoreductase (luciferase family)
MTDPRLGLCLAVPPMPLPASLELARVAERRGAAALAVGEARYDSLAAAAAVVTATAHVPVMTAVTTWARSPVAAAVGALTLVELSGGRFTLGLGTMPPAWNRDFHGIDPSRPLARLREYVAVLRAASSAWAGAPATFSGEFFSVNGFGADRPAPPPPVPVWLAVTRPATARLAARIGDGAIINVVHTVRWLREVLVPALGELPRAVMLRVVVHDGSAAARAEAVAQAGASLQRYRAVPYFREVAAAEGLDPDRLDEPALVNAFVVVGTVDEIRARLAEYVGLVDLILLTPATGQPQPHQALTYEALLGMLA